MPKLIVNPRTDQSWEIPLPTGVTVLGSDPALAFPIAHDTVSPAHCEISVADGAVRIKDLGSACGTFIDHAPVTDSAVAPGQSIQLGGVELALASEAPDLTAPPLPPRIPMSAPVAPAGPAGSSACRYHPKALATWHCGKCQMFFCDLCVNVRRMGESVRHLCRKCGTDCAAVEVQYEEPVDENFYQMLPDAFAYPLRGSGAVLLASGTVVFAGLSFLKSAGRFVPFYGWVVGWGIGIFVTGYVFSYWKSIVQNTAQGQNEPPDWPDFSDWISEIVQPFGQFLALLVLTFGPYLVLAAMGRYYAILGNAPEWWDSYGGLLTVVALVAGALFAPMAMLLLAMFDSIVALNPLPIIRSILRIPLPYLVAAGTFEVVIVAYVMIDRFVHLMGASSLFMGLVMGFLELYSFSVGMRILGLLYRTHKDALAWT